MKIAHNHTHTGGSTVHGIAAVEEDVVIRERQHLQASPFNQNVILGGVSRDNSFT